MDKSWKDYKSAKFRYLNFYLVHEEDTIFRKFKTSLPNTRRIFENHIKMILDDTSSQILHILKIKMKIQAMLTISEITVLSL